MENENKDIQAMQGLAITVSELLEHPKVKEYLSVMKVAGNLEKLLKAWVLETQNSVEYFDPIKNSKVTISPTVKTTYNVDLDEVVMKFWQEYVVTEQKVNVKMMQASPKCAGYLESVSEQKIVPTKRVIK